MKKMRKKYPISTFRKKTCSKQAIEYRISNIGFTLIELLVAMTIMAVLMAISLVSYQGSKKAARDSKRKADLEQLRSALEIYRNDCQTYPEDSEIVVGSPLVGTKSAPATTCLTTDTYIEVVPTDPGERSYYYNRVGANAYILCASLEISSETVEGCGSCGTGFTCNYKATNP